MCCGRSVRRARAKNYLFFGIILGFVMDKEKIIDWRIAAMTLLAKDIPSAFPGGPSHKVGTPIYSSHLAFDKKHNTLGFITPSAIALILDVALQASISANSIFETLKYTDVITPVGNGVSIADKSTSNLFDFFEHCMVSAIFSFQAVEAYSNALISYDPNRILKVKVRKELKELRAYEVERQFSTIEKVSEILPILTGTSINKNDSRWENFILLKQTRDSIVHIKYEDMYGHRPKKPEKESLYFQFLNKSSFIYPKTAYDVIGYFNEARGKELWQQQFEDNLNATGKTAK
jgi:hypothetical protein